jgi:CBS domain-containing membrane protein
MQALTVRDLMSTNVVTFFPELSLPLAEDVLRIHKFRHLPVIDTSGFLVGLVTRTDLLRAQISTLTGLTEDQRRARLDNIQIGQLMTIDVVTVRAHELATTAAKTLLDNSFSCLPVVDDAGVLIGIVTERDFLRFALQALDVVATLV